MYYAVDRFEDDRAVLCDENEQTITVRRAALSAETAVGDWLIQTADGFQVDAAETARRRERVRQLQEKWRRRV